jgi:predicted transcriptional regulator
MADVEKQDLTALTVTLLSAYVTNNNVESGALADLIASTHSALVKTGEEPQAPTEQKPEVTPAVSVRKSLSSKEHILSLIDGRPYKTLKRHLASHGMTPADYRSRYSLPASYPMVAPAYSEHRRSVAEKVGLGQRLRPGTKSAKPKETTATETAAPAAIPAKTSGRKPAKAAAAPAKTKTTAPKVSKPRAAKAATAAPAASTAKPESKAPRAAKKTAAAAPSAKGGRPRKTASAEVKPAKPRARRAKPAATAPTETKAS